LYISGTTATCSSELSGGSAVTAVTVYQSLQIKNSQNNWETIANWSQSTAGRNASMLNTYSPLSSGTYRLKSVYYVYTNNGYEVIEKISIERTL
jgi:hypothetical protein